MGSIVLYAASLPEQSQSAVARKLSLKEVSSNGFSFFEAPDNQYAAFSGDVMLSTSRKLLATAGKAKPVVMDWALRKPGDIEFLVNPDYKIEGFTLRGAVIRDKRGEGYMDFDIQNSVAARKKAQQLIPAFAQWAVLTIDFNTTQQGIESLLVDWNGRGMADGELPTGQRQVYDAMSAYLALGKTLGYGHVPFSPGALRKEGFGRELVALYKGNNWKTSVVAAKAQ